MGFPFRVLETGYGQAAFNMGLDEAVLESVATGAQLPTLRLYGWNPAAISLGYFQKMEEEVDVEACRRAGVDIVRRITGGGAVFHEAEVTYSIVIPEGHPLAPPSIAESYGILCAGIIEGLKPFGLEAAFAPINDILVAGRKISGNAQTRKRGCLLQHGTVLLAVDPEMMFSLLKVPKEKSLGKLIADVKARVTSLEDALGRTVAYPEAEPALLDGFVRALGLDIEKAEPSEQEMAAAARLAGEKFSLASWNARR